MTQGEQLAHRLKEVILNGTWVANTNFQLQLANINREEAVRKIDSLNTIAVLTSHIHYYIAGILNVLEGGTLDIRDKYSFDFPPVESQNDWEKIKDKLWKDTERFAELVSKMSDDQLGKDFTDKKYGSYQRNIDAMIEHSYYHLGQIVLLRKMMSK